MKLSKYFIYCLFPILVVACQSQSAPSLITLEDINQSSNRNIDSIDEDFSISKVNTDKIRFLDENNNEISQEAFNWKVSEGHFIGIEDINPSGNKEVRLISKEAYIHQIAASPIPAFHIQDLYGKSYSKSDLKEKNSFLVFGHPVL